ncbi:MAG: RecQ family ATP-dependent DNA helicase [Flavobacteriales bacterium]|nr:RecQ family ATP-dependent DNA helicase [Flavobacteriales bacterium]
MPLKTLQHYWGYSEFRPPQAEIIDSILKGNNTLALLPTGGGKSICYQIPALLLEGVCLVVSPLIALMRDQVEQLKRRGISSTFLHSGQSRNEINIELENIRNGKYKLVYVSPERIHSQAFIETFKQTKISFLAVDEAHCISQWGFDFRPEYRNIASLKEHLPNLKMMALTASATPKVKADIIEQLQIENVQVFTKSFHRENLHYHVVFEEDKRRRLLRLCQSQKGSGVVYVRNRRKTVELSNYLKSQNVSCDFYHAGLTSEQRNQKQDSWASGATKIIISTNAFGMGIDKADVRFVAHYDLPESLEAYYQEAGRAGRDEQKAWCILFYNNADLIDVKTQLHSRFPELPRINKIYENLCNYFQLAFHSGLHTRFDFDLADFVKKFENNPIESFAAIKLLEQLGYLSLSEGVYTPSKVKVEMDATSLYDFQLKNPKLDPTIKILLRSYSGIFEHYVSIKEKLLASKLKITEQQFVANLKRLSSLKIIDYVEQSDKPYILFLRHRVNEIMDADNMLEKNKTRTTDRLLAMIQYVEAETCRAKIICDYFGEQLHDDCGHCDVCRLKQRYAFSAKKFTEIENFVFQTIDRENLVLDDLLHKNHTFEFSDIKNVIRWLMDDEKLKIDASGYLKKRN